MDNNNKAFFSFFFPIFLLHFSKLHIYILNYYDYLKYTLIYFHNILYNANILVQESVKVLPIQSYNLKSFYQISY